MSLPENPRQPVLMKDFPVACKAICDLMPRLRERFVAVEVLGRRLFSVDFLATLSGEMLVTLIYHRKLDSDWESVELRVALDQMAASPDALSSESRETLLAKARSGDIVVIDVRPEAEYTAGHLPFARSLPLAELEKRLADLPAGKEIAG